MEQFKQELTKRFQDSFTKEEIFSIIDDVEKHSVLESMGFRIDGSNYLVEYEDKRIKLPKKMFLLLRFLVLNKNKIVTREQILNHVWGSEIIVVERTIDVHIRKLREKFPVNYFVTKKTLGYGWIEKD